MSYYMDLKFVNEEGDEISLSNINEYEGSYALLTLKTVRGFETKEVTLKLKSAECVELSNMLNIIRLQILDGDKK